MGGLNQVGRSQKDQEVIPRGVDKVERENDKPRRTTSRTKSALRTKRDIAFLKEFHKNRIGYIWSRENNEVDEEWRAGYGTTAKRSRQTEKVQSER